MNILLTNDDGVLASGLWTLHAALVELGSVTVIAPRKQQSGIGHAITYRTPISTESVTLESGCQAYALTGTPADCVKFGVLQLLETRPDMVVSGINLGLNLGYNIFYSGTVAAAIEGAMNGIPSVAFSIPTTHAHQLPEAADQAARVLKLILANEAAGALAYNVNIPALRDGDPDILFTHHKAVPFLERYVRHEDEDGVGYQLDLAQGEQNPGRENSDVYAIEAGMISVTPLRANLTDLDSLRLLGSTDRMQHKKEPVPEGGKVQ